MTKYLYKGQEVTLVPGQQFTSYWNVYYQMPMENGGSKQTIVSCVIGQDLQLVDDSAPIAIADKPNVANVEFNINTANFTALRQHLPGIGRVAPKTIQNNKPQGGYKDFDEFCELNKKLNLNWEELKSVLLFE